MKQLVIKFFAEEVNCLKGLKINIFILIKRNFIYAVGFLVSLDKSSDVAKNKTLYAFGKLLIYMSGILVSWIGKADLRGGLKEVMDGPLVSILSFKSFSLVQLLHNQPYEEVEGFLSRLQEDFECKFEVVKANLESPIHFGDIYRTLDSTLTELRSSHPKEQMYIQLTSGTPVMTSVSILTGKTKYQVKFLQSSEERGAEEVDIPFDVAADFLPSISGSIDERLNQLMMVGKVPSTAAFDSIITQDPKMKALIKRAAILADNEVSVLIHGETGTGKELFAQAIHNTSERAGKAFVALNCGAIAPEIIDSELFGHEKGAFTGANKAREGKFELADGGTLFLDEFGELTLDAQVRLLRVLQEGKLTRVGGNDEISVDVRIIAATNQDLPRAIAEGRFREDLYYRVAIGVIELPPIRERSGDILFLAEHILNKIRKDDSSDDVGGKNISAGAKKIILNHRWPGNFRELEATLKRAHLWNPISTLTEVDIAEALMGFEKQDQGLLGRDVSQGVDIEELIDELKMHYIQKALVAASGKKKKAAELLKLKHYQTLSNWMEKLGLD